MAALARAVTAALTPAQVDPSKSSDDSTCASNVAKLMHATQLVLDAIFSSVQQCPAPLRRLSAFIRQEVELK